MTAHFFKDAGDARRWFEKHGARESELLVGFWKVSAGKPGARYQEVLDAALCVGWIDGLRKNRDAESWTIRFSPRKPGSIWSGVNIKRAGELIAGGRMKPAGLKAFEARDEKKSRSVYEAYKTTPLGKAEEHQLRANGKAWAYWEAVRPSYRKSASHWVMTAKKEETRRRRLEQLVACCEKEEWLPQYRWAKK
ncbi:MAG TPA: YdeI/OmpD-associated family protein [Myxococcaceae bacterium]|nr:YdeI/OmpD-associated family protein [Myxococcaceae bacterium]